jgi:large-conductance mechanosensitive channel
MDEINDNKLKALLKDSKLEMPFSDFEDKMMARVKTELHGKHSILKNLRLSWFFFLMGSAFGLLVSITLPMIQFEWGGFDIKSLKYPIMAVVLFIIIWQLDEMIKLTLRQKRQKRLS